MRTDNYCLHCKALDVEPAAEGCKNPDWHEGRAAEHQEKVRLPYAEDG